jgi:hypothetical protein
MFPSRRHPALEVQYVLLLASTMSAFVVSYSQSMFGVARRVGRWVSAHVGREMQHGIFLTFTAVG